MLPPTAAGPSKMGGVAVTGGKEGGKIKYETNESELHIVSPFMCVLCLIEESCVAIAVAAAADHTHTLARHSAPNLELNAQHQEGAAIMLNWDQVAVAQANKKAMQGGRGRRQRPVQGQVVTAAPVANPAMARGSDQPYVAMGQ